MIDFFTSIGKFKAVFLFVISLSNGSSSNRFKIRLAQGNT